MTSRIPPEIREQVLVLWLQAVSRDEISKKLGIGTGTVSETVKDYKKLNPEFDILRELVVTVKKQGSNIGEYADSIRLKRLLKSYDLSSEQIELFVKKAAEHCFKKKVEIKKYIEDVDMVSNLSAKFGMDLEQMPDYIRENKKELDSLSFQVLLKKAEKDQALQEHHITQKQLEEFRKNMPRVQEMQATKSLLENNAREKDILRRALESCVRELIWEKYCRTLLAHELAKSSKLLCGNVDQARTNNKSKRRNEISS